MRVGTEVLAWRRDRDVDKVAGFAARDHLQRIKAGWCDVGRQSKVDLPEAWIAAGSTGIQGSDACSAHVHRKIAWLRLIAGGTAGVVRCVGASSRTPEHKRVARMSRR